MYLNDRKRIFILAQAARAFQSMGMGRIIPIIPI